MSGPAIARALLVADVTLVAAIPAASIIVGIVPQGTALPCIAITETFASDRSTVKGSRGVSVKVTSLCQVTVMAATYPACKAAMKKARAALRDFVGTIGDFQAATCRLEGKGPDFETDAGFCAQTQDVRITYDEDVSAAVFSPSQISFTSGLWLDPSDITTGSQDSAGTSPQTASAQPTGKRLDKSGRGNHVLQATAGRRPEYDVISGISSDFTDGLDDGYSTATFVAGTLVAAMDFFITIKRATTASMVVASQAPTDGTRFLGAMDGSASAAFPGAGAAFTCFVDGVAVGTAGSCTRLQLGTALGSGAYHVLEVRDLDLSLWTQFTVGLYSSFMLNADMAQLVLCPSQSSTIRAKLRTYCGAKVGLSL